MKVSNISILSLALALNGAVASSLRAREQKVVTVIEYETEYVHVTSTTWVDPAQYEPTADPTTTPDPKEKFKNHVSTSTSSTTLSTTSTSVSSTSTTSTPTSTTKSIPTTTKPPTTLQTSTLSTLSTSTSTPPVKVEPSTTTPAPAPTSPSGGTPNVGSSTGGGATHSGEATFYSAGLGSCGINSQDSEYIVAISKSLMDTKKTSDPNKNPFCGTTILVSYKGGPKIPVTCVDTCPECAQYDLDLSPAAFKAMGAQSEQGRVDIEWCFT